MSNVNFSNFEDYHAHFVAEFDQAIDLGGRVQVSLNDLRTINWADPHIVEEQITCFESMVKQVYNQCVQARATRGFLNLSGRGIDVAPDLTSYKALRNLNLSNNELTNSPDVTKLPNLTKLNLAGNRLTEAPDVSQNRNLEYLDLKKNGLTTLSDFDKNPKLQELNISCNNLTELPDSIVCLPRSCLVDARENLFSAEYIASFQENLKCVRAQSPGCGPTVLMSKDLDLLKTQNERGQTLFHELVEEQAHIPESLNIQKLESILNILNESDQIDLLSKQDIRGKTVFHYAWESKNPILKEALLDYLRNKCLEIGPDSRRIFEKSDESGNTVFKILLRNKKGNIRTRKWQLGPDQTLSKWLHKNPHTNKCALMLYPEFDHNQACAVVGKTKEYLLNVSDHFNVLAVKVDCVEAAISALHEQGKKISLLHIEGHGPGREIMGPGYIRRSRVQFGDPKSKKAGRTPLLTVGNQAWIEALIATMEVGGTIIFNACALGRPEPADQNLPQEIASKLKDKDITVIASSVDINRRVFSYDPQAPERVRFSDPDSNQEQDTTVVYRTKIQLIDKEQIQGHLETIFKACDEFLELAAEYYDLSAEGRAQFLADNPALPFGEIADYRSACDYVMMELKPEIIADCVSQADLINQACDTEQEAARRLEMYVQDIVQQLQGK